jgi:hypothetical protein
VQTIAQQLDLWTTVSGSQRDFHDDILPTAIYRIPTNALPSGGNCLCHDTFALPTFLFFWCSLLWQDQRDVRTNQHLSQKGNQRQPGK